MIYNEYGNNIREYIGHDKNSPDRWIDTTIKDVCENINGTWKSKKDPYVNVGVIRNANFTKDFKLDYSNIEYIDVEQRAFLQRHLRLFNNGEKVVATIILLEERSFMKGKMKFFFVILQWI